MANIWKRIKKVRRGSRAARMLCEHLQGMGIDARMIEEEGNRVAITGQEIDVIEVNYIGGGQYGPAHYSIYYGVRCNLEGVEKQFQTRIKVKTKGLIRREIVNVKWESRFDRSIADELNRDGELMSLLLQQLKEGEGTRLVDLSPDKKTGIVWITTTKIRSPFPKAEAPFQIPSDLMPSETSLQLYSAIARHIRNRIDSNS